MTEIPAPWLRESHRPRTSTGMCLVGGVVLVGFAVAMFAITAALLLGLYRILGPWGTLLVIVFTGLALGWQEARR